MRAPWSSLTDSSAPVVIQNNLQFVAVSNLEAATFQVSYQMKILTTAAFSVVLLRKKLTPTKWLALLFLAIGVGIVQIQNTGHKSSEDSERDMNALKGFMAVVAACFTSGLAGVYFELVLKNSSGDLWVRNVQLSLFSLLPALVPIVFTASPSDVTASGWFTTSLFANFTVWAWATVLTQVIGGLLTALVIKYADNILKGFATSLSIVISFLASVALFNFHITIAFVLGALVVLVATWMYNQPDTASASSTPGSESSGRWSWRWRRPTFSTSRNASALELNQAGGTLSRRASTSSLSSLASFHSTHSLSHGHSHAYTHNHHAASKSYPSSPIEREREAPILGQVLEKNLLANVKSLGSKRAGAGVGAGEGQGRFFAAPLRTSSSFTKQMSLFRSASYSGANGAGGNAEEYQPLAQMAPSAPSRPGSALASYPVSRPSSALGSSSSSSDHEQH